MSYDIYLRKNGVCIDVGNYTYNVANMFNIAYGVTSGWRDLLQNQVCKDVTKKIDSAVKIMKKRKKDLEKLNPPNGCGSYKGALDFQKNLLEFAKEYPDYTIIIS